MAPQNEHDHGTDEEVPGHRLGEDHHPQRDRHDRHQEVDGGRGGGPLVLDQPIVQHVSNAGTPRGRGAAAPRRAFGGSLSLTWLLRRVISQEYDR